MNESDVVAGLDAAFAELPATSRYDDDYAIVLPASLVQRARDEIVALRSMLTENELAANRALVDLAELKLVVEQMPAKVRAEALEEAAAEAGKWATGKAARSAIRALKDKPQ